MMVAYYVLVFGVVSLFVGSVFWGLWWALKGGQFSDFQRGATSIFDEEEPLGHMTDAFPDRKDEVARIRTSKEAT